MAETATILASITLQQTSDLESVMLAEDKLFVVLAVVLVIWFGIILFLVRNDRKIAALERRLGERKGERNNRENQTTVPR